MDVFDLDERTLDQYAKFARSFTKIRSGEIQEKVDRLYQERRFWPEPLIQLNSHYESGGSIRDLVGEGALAPECAQIFRDLRSGSDSIDLSLKLRRQAIGLALAGKGLVVTTGTGSGKSLCYFAPIVDAVVKAKGAGEGARTRALVIIDLDERDRLAAEAFTYLFEQYADMPLAEVHAEVVINPKVVADWTFPGVTTNSVSHWHLIEAAP